MSVNIGAIIAKVNKACDELDFVSARAVIEMNLVDLSEAKYYRLLNANAKVLIKHVIADHENPNKNENALTRAEILTIHKINEYCTNFDIPMLKRTLAHSLELVQRPDVIPLLNSDAKIILENMGALLGKYQIK